MIQAVIFDMDGTLIDTEKYYRICWPQVLAHFGYTMSDEQALSMRSLGQPYAPEHLKEMFQDPDLDYPAIRVYRKQLMEEYLERDGIQIKPGAVELLEYLKEKKISHIQDSTNLSDEYTRNRIRHHILPILEQQVNGKAAAHMAETAARISQAEEYLTQQSCLVLGEFQKGKEYYFTEKFFMEPQIIQVYALQQAMEQLAGRRKDLAAVHYEKVLELYEMQTGRRISLPYHMEARRDYEGVRLCRYGEEKSAGMIGEKHKGSDIQNGKTVCGKNISDREWKIRIPGTVTSPLGIFSAEIFLYEGQKIEEKKYTKWLDYDKIKKNPHIRTRRTGDYMVINAQGNTKKLNRCMIDEKIPSEYRDSIPLIACGKEILWMVGSRMNERYKINPQTRKVLVLNYQGGNENE